MSGSHWTGIGNTCLENRCYINYEGGFIQCQEPNLVRNQKYGC